MLVLQCIYICMDTNTNISVHMEPTEKILMNISTGTNAHANICISLNTNTSPMTNASTIPYTDTNASVIIQINLQNHLYKYKHAC